MTDQNATGTPTFPPGRYGRRRAPRRSRPALTALLVVLMALGCGAIGYRLYRSYGDPEHSARILAETDRTADRVTVRFEVRSRAGAGPALCRLRARAADGLVIGTADVPVPAGRRVVATHTLDTGERAFIVDIPGCRAADVGR